MWASSSVTVQAGVAGTDRRPSSSLSDSASSMTRSWAFVHSVIASTRPTLAHPFTRIERVLARPGPSRDRGLALLLPPLLRIVDGPTTGTLGSNGGIRA